MISRLPNRMNADASRPHPGRSPEPTVADNVTQRLKSFQTNFKTREIPQASSINDSSQSAALFKEARPLSATIETLIRGDISVNTGPGDIIKGSELGGMERGSLDRTVNNIAANQAARIDEIA